MIELKHISKDDARDLYELANDPYIREVSFSSESFSFEDHCTWLDSLLCNPEEELWKIVEDDNFIGQIRFSIDRNSRRSLIGISLTSRSRGKGIAAIALKKLLYKFTVNNPEIITIEAQIKKENESSIAFFEKSGFIFKRSLNIKGYDAKSFEYNTNRAFIIAELSANHGHNIDIALRSIDAAAEAGADAVKIQTYTADTITIDCRNDFFMIDKGTLWDGKSLYDLYQEAYTPWDWHSRLKERAESLGMVFFSTPFDASAVDYLEEMDNPIYKIASFEITDIPLIEYTASKMKPMIISTGIAEIDEIADAVDACRRVGNFDITLLKCTSSYPARIEDTNLKTMVNMVETFGVKTGLSDHTIGADVPVAAAILGASVIEKHFILDKSIGGPDAAFSMEKEDFRKMVDSIRKAELSLGTVTYSLSEKSRKNREFARSLFIVEDIKKGEQLSEKNVKSIRPGNGIKPAALPFVLGKTVICDLQKGTPLSWSYIGGE